MYNITDIKPYVYLGIHKVTKKFYIGVRYGNVKIKKAINEDFGKIYKTSSKEVKPIFDEFEWTIIKIFATSNIICRSLLLSAILFSFIKSFAGF